MSGFGEDGLDPFYSEHLSVENAYLSGFYTPVTMGNAEAAEPCNLKR